MNDDTPQQLSTFRRILNFVRFWYYIRANVTVVLANQANIARALQSSAAVINQLNARVTWYEKRVPLIAKEYLAFRHHEKKAIESLEAQENYAEREKRRAAETQTVDDAPRPQLELVSR